MNRNIIIKFRARYDLVMNKNILMWSYIDLDKAFEIVIAACVNKHCDWKKMCRDARKLKRDLLLKVNDQYKARY